MGCRFLCGYLKMLAGSDREEKQRETCLQISVGKEFWIQSSVGFGSQKSQHTGKLLLDPIFNSKPDEYTLSFQFIRYTDTIQGNPVQSLCNALCK